MFFLDKVLNDFNNSADWYLVSSFSSLNLLYWPMYIYGYIKDIQNLHFYYPESFSPGDTIICNKATRRTFENSTLLYETAHYRVYLQN